MRTSVDDLAACYFCMICMALVRLVIVLITCHFIAIDKGLTKLFENHMNRWCTAKHWWIGIGCFGLVYFRFRLDHQKYGMYKQTHQWYGIYSRRSFVIWPQTCLLGSFIHTIHQLEICHLSWIHMCSEWNLECIPRDFGRTKISELIILCGIYMPNYDLGMTDSSIAFKQ